MQFDPYLNFDGQTAEAFRFYEQVFGGKIVTMVRFSESPMADQVGPEWQERIMHARLVVGDQVLMASDSPPGQYRKPEGLWVSINIEEPKDAERIFRTLADRGTVQMPFEETFWAAGGFGMLADRFGTPWMINCATGT